MTDKVKTDTVKRKLDQIILRIDDEFGNHHIIRYSSEYYSYTIEGYSERPENYLLPPAYLFPFTKEEVKNEFAKQNKEWKFG